MTSEQCDALKDIFRNVVAVGKRQQLELAAYMAVFNTFKKMYPQYTQELDANLEAAHKHYRSSGQIFRSI